MVFLKKMILQVLKIFLALKNLGTFGGHLELINLSNNTTLEHLSSIDDGLSNID